jgi:hypothetical protein
MLAPPEKNENLRRRVQQYLFANPEDFLLINQAENGKFISKLSSSMSSTF